MICARTLTPWIFLLFCLAGSSAWAEDSVPLRVGRVSAVDVTVAVRPAGGEWADSGVNDPIAAGMSVRTPVRGRAILRIGPETIALAPSSELDLARLDAGTTQIVLHQGRIGVRLARIEPGRSIEIDLARGGVWLLSEGDYDIAAGDERAPARIAVFDGRARVVGKREAPEIDTTIATGAAILLSGAPVVASLDGAVADDFAGWWRPAGGDQTESAALRYISPEMTGYEALDGNGRWETVEGYGAVWFPTTVQDDWAPYRHGHWRWVAPWGWSWIDDMAWGFATSHYGRWASIPETDPLDPSGPGPERWGWVPGSRVAEPVYAPALVAFLGTAGVGLSYADAFAPAVAWFPLAPGDVYWPGYASDLDQIRRLNAGAVADLASIAPGVDGAPPAEIVNGDYPNRRFASAVPRAVFLAGRPVAAALLTLPERRLANAPLLAGSPQLAPAAPRAAAVATASRAANRLADAAVPKLARAIHTLARILRPQSRTTAARMKATRTAATRMTAAHPALPARTARLPLSNAQPARPRAVVVAASHIARARLHLAAGHRATMAR
jgi:uncharacterized protein DUF6600